MRTTIDLDDDILRALKRRQREERKTLGQLASNCLRKLWRPSLLQTLTSAGRLPTCGPVWILTTRTLFGRFWTVGERNL